MSLCIFINCVNNLIDFLWKKEKEQKNCGFNKLNNSNLMYNRPLQLCSFDDLLPSSHSHKHLPNTRTFYKKAYFVFGEKKKGNSLQTFPVGNQSSFILTSHIFFEKKNPNFVWSKLFIHLTNTTRCFINNTTTGNTSTEVSMPVHTNCTNSVHVVTLLQGNGLVLKK